jgi:hypothetical protein
MFSVASSATSSFSALRPGSAAASDASAHSAKLVLVHGAFEPRDESISRSLPDEPMLPPFASRSID